MTCVGKTDHLGYKFFAFSEITKELLLLNCFFQPSSKSDNRLFCIKFEISNAKDYPFLQAVSNPIRCISISPDVQPLFVTPKRLTNIDHPSSTKSPDLVHNTCSVKRIRLGKESVSGSEESYQQCNSDLQTSRQVYTESHFS